MCQLTTQDLANVYLGLRQLLEITTESQHRTQSLVDNQMRSRSLLTRLLGLLEARTSVRIQESGPGPAELLGELLNDS